MYRPYTTLFTGLLKSVMMVCDRHHVEELLHNSLRWLQLWLYLSKKWISYIRHIYMILLQSTQGSWIKTCSIASVYSPEILPIWQWSHSTAHFCIFCKQLKETHWSMTGIDFSVCIFAFEQNTCAWKPKRAFSTQGSYESSMHTSPTLPSSIQHTDCYAQNSMTFPPKWWLILVKDDSSWGWKVCQE